jgi:hypothetical protein
MSQYIPDPINTTKVELNPVLIELTDLLAKNTHDVWAQQRIKDGWTYGPVRDDANKKHPCLVPYEELPKQEKEYDRNTSLETLKLIITLGFKIE